VDAQNIVWNQCYGGSYMDIPQSILECKKGYMLIGHSNSDDGDILSEGFSGYDIWLAKINDQGIVEWENKYGGHSSFDFGFDIIDHPKGYFLLTSSFSRDGQRKARDLLGHDDIWIVNIDKEGKLKKHYTIGGSLDEFPRKIIPTKDKGFAVIANTKSRDKDVDEYFGRQDVWVLKLNKKGKVKWNVNLGSKENDEGYDIIELQDGSLLIAGETRSDKEDPQKYDAWLIKLNSKGVKLWEKRYGGSEDDRAKCLIQNDNGDIFLGGETESQDGPFSSNQGAYDCFLLKIDANGNMDWAKTFGGNGIDYTEKIIYDEENEQLILLNGSTSKDGDVGKNNGGLDVWVSLHEANGKFTKGAVYGGKKDEEVKDIIMDKKGDILVLSSSNSNDGDIETRNAYAKTNYWLLKLNFNESELADASYSKGYALAKDYSGAYVLGGLDNNKSEDVRIQEYDLSGFESAKRTVPGEGDDRLYQILQATDGTSGFYFCGSTSSKRNHYKKNQGERDAYLSKVKDNGKIFFTHTFGGKYDDVAYSLCKYDQNSFILAGTTKSKDGDVESQHHGDDDMWIVKMNKIGEIDWERCVGGTENDLARSVVLNAKKQIVAVGYSQSKDRDVKRSYGNMDGMMTILSDTGKVLMVRNYGGNSNDWFNDVCLTSDGGYLFIGGTKSHLEGSSFHGGKDIWIVKANAFGALDWEVTFGGKSNDEAMAVIPIGRGEFVVACNSNSGEKGPINNYVRVLKINNKGKILEDKTIEQLNPIFCQDIIQLEGNNYVLGGYDVDESGLHSMWSQEFRF
tara:strand:+ start:1898 stop:4276 length:2379 start_codon:yes stop_codon:yes gene_type:complete